MVGLLCPENKHHGLNQLLRNTISVSGGLALAFEKKRKSNSTRIPKTRSHDYDIMQTPLGQGSVLCRVTEQRVLASAAGTVYASSLHPCMALGAVVPGLETDMLDSSSCACQCRSSKASLQMHHTTVYSIHNRGLSSSAGVIGRGPIYCRKT